MGFFDRFKGNAGPAPARLSVDKNEPVAVLYGKLAEHLHAVGSAIVADVEAVKKGAAPKAVAALPDGAITAIQKSMTEGQAVIIGCARGPFGDMKKQSFDPSMMETLFNLNGTVALLNTLLPQAMQEDAVGDHVRMTVDQTLARCVGIIINCIYARAYATRNLHVIGMTGGPQAAAAEKMIPALIKAANDNGLKYCQPWAASVFDQQRFISMAQSINVDSMPMLIGHDLEREPGKTLNGVWLTGDMYDAMIAHLARMQAQAMAARAAG